MENVGRVFLLESPNPLDLLEERGERSSLENICKLFGYDVASFLLRDSRELKQTMMYLSAITHLDNAGDAPLFIHISSHGNSDGISIGSDSIVWKKLTKIILDTYDNLDSYSGPIVLIISACGASDQEITSFISERYDNDEILNPPDYIFVFSEDEIGWRDAVVTWTIFYRYAMKLNFLDVDKKSIGGVQEVLLRIGKSGFGTLTYFRWDGEKYKRFNSEEHTQNKDE